MPTAGRRRRRRRRAAARSPTTTTGASARTARARARACVCARDRRDATDAAAAIRTRRCSRASSKSSCAALVRRARAPPIAADRRTRAQAPLDHSTIKYIKINKCFYKEADVVAARPWSDVSEARRAKRASRAVGPRPRGHWRVAEISVEGGGALKPVTNFDQASPKRRAACPRASALSSRFPRARVRRASAGSSGACSRTSRSAATRRRPISRARRCRRHWSARARARAVERSAAC